MELVLAYDFETVKSRYIDVIDHTAGIKQYARWEYGRHPTEQGLRSYIENGEMYLLLVQGDIVGMVAVVMSQEQEYEDVPWTKKLENHEVATLHLLAVCPEYQGKSLGSVILDLAGELAKRHGKKALRLDVLESNLPAQRMYEKAGWDFNS